MQEKFRARRAAAPVETLFGVNTTAGYTRLGLANAIISGLPVSALDQLTSVVAHR